MKSKAIEIFAEKSPTGGWLLSTIACGRRIARRYLGYTKREAVKLFREHVKQQLKSPAPTP